MTIKNAQKISKKIVLSILLFTSVLAYSQIEKNYIVSQGYSLFGRSIAPTDNNCCLVVCNADSSMNTPESFIEPMYIFKIDQFGDSIWTKQLEISNLKSTHKIKKINEGNYIIMAESYSSEIILLKITSDANVIWEKRFPALYDNGFWVQDMVIAQNGDFIVCGWDLDSDYMMKPYLLRTDGNGSQLWYREDYTSDLIDITARALVEDADGNIYMAGHIDPQTGGGAWNHDVCLIKTDQNGNELWKKTFDGAYDSGDPDYAESIIISNDNKLLLTGQSFNGDIGYVTHFYKIDLDGNLIVKEEYHNGEINGLSIQQSPDNSIYIAGRGFDASLSNSYINNILKLSDDGQLIWSQFYADYTAINDYTIVKGEAPEVYLFSNEKWMTVGDITFGESLDINSTYIAPHSLYIITPDINISTNKVQANIGLVEVYPNPAHDFLNISFKERNAGYIQLTNSNGEACRQITFGENIERLVINIKELKSGVYLLYSEMGNKTQTKKIVIQ